MAGGSDESIFQPEWSPDGALYFVSDRTGWWNLYRWQAGRVEPLPDMEAEFGVPQWVFGMSTYAFESAERIVCATRRTASGTWRRWTRGRGADAVRLPYTEFSDVRAGAGGAFFLAGSPSQCGQPIVRLDLATGQVEGAAPLQRRGGRSGYLSLPQAIEFPTEGGLTAYGFFYAPRNRDFAAPARRAAAAARAQPRRAHRRDSTS